jgi:hypothetical protein
MNNRYTKQFIVKNPPEGIEVYYQGVLQYRYSDKTAGWYALRNFRERGFELIYS